MYQDLNDNMAEVINTSKLRGDAIGGGFIRTLGRIFNLISADTFNLNGLFEAKSEQARTEIAQKLYDFYQGDMEQIESHIIKALGRTFRSEDIAQFQMIYLPVLRRIIDKLCLVYKSKTERTLQSEGATKKLNELYAGSDIDTKSKHWYRMAKVFHTVLVQPVVRTQDDKQVLTYEIWTPNKISVVEREDNFLRPAKVVYQIQMRKPNGVADIETVYWSDTEHFRTDAHGKLIRDEDNPNGENPYKILPFVVLRLKETENFWGEGETLLANVEEKIDFLLIQLMDLLVMQGHGQPVLINAKVEGTIQTGPRHPLMLIPHNPDAPTDFKFVSVAGKVSEITSAIDWLISRTMTLYGLAQSSTMESSQTASGYAKMLDNWDVIEQREEDVAVLKEFEKELFRMTKIVVEYEDLMSFGETDELNIEFEGYQFPQDPKVELEVKKEKMNLGLWTPADDLMMEDSTLTKEEALSKLEENLTIRNRLRDEFGLTVALSGQEKTSAGMMYEA